ncbi:MAG: GYDIA family GHMP kinase, partial [Marinilabiliaceae bacterium]
GKLLLTGEYLVLHGALALAVPLNRGQSLTVRDKNIRGIEWKALHPEGHWFFAQLDEDLKIIETDAPVMAERLKNMLVAAMDIKPSVINMLWGKSITTQLEFHPQWGWGSSSTLISNLSQWLKIDPYQLLEKTFGGSGYDLACATATGPIFYQWKNNAPNVQQTGFNPPFEEQLWMVYLNRKQDSAKAIREHQKNSGKQAEMIKEISQISREMVISHSQDHFMKLMNEHENIISCFTGLTRVKYLYFPDFPGEIKSLGAWGGDFVLALSELSANETLRFFQTKGHPTLFNFLEIKHKQNNE